MATPSRSRPPRAPRASPSATTAEETTLAAAPFLLIAGDNPAAREKEIAKALDAHFGPGNARERHLFQGTETSAESLALALSPSLFAARAAVVVQAIQECPASILELLASTAPSAIESDIAVILAGDKGPNATTKAGKALVALVRKLGKEIPCAAPKLHELPGWVSNLAQERFGRRLDRAAAQLLVERAGTTDFRKVGEVLSDLERELEKLDTRLPPKAPVTASLVDELVGDRRPVSFQDFQDALLHRQPAKAIESWYRLRDEGLPAFPLMQRSYADFVQLFRLRRALDRGQSARAAAAEIGINAFLLEKRQLEAAARRRSAARWLRDIATICRIEGGERRGLYPLGFQIELELYAISR